MNGIAPFEVAVPEVELADLRERLARIRWPDAETVDDWSQGVPLSAMQDLVDHWANRYDWRRCERRLNALPHYLTEIDGLPIHFIHVRSPHPNALPLLITHGWPGSVLEFLDCIGPLTEPEKHGGDPADAFHLVIPSLPGYGFSGKPSGTGWTVEKIACAWAVLMERLGYSRYVAQGGDWGSAVTRAMASQKPAGLCAIHLNMVVVFPGAGEDCSDPEAREAIAVADEHKRSGLGYSTQQSTKPQTLAYSLADSPVGQAAWIYEKLHAWTDNGSRAEDAIDRDAILDLITLYWLTGTGGSSARLYWESFRSAFGSEPIDIPVACSIFPQEMRRPPRRWAERVFSNIIYWNRPERGGHFAAFEQPEIFTRELRDALRSMR